MPEIDKNNSTSARSSGNLSYTFPDYRWLADNEQSLAGAALQFVESINYDITPANSKVKQPVLNILEILKNVHLLFQFT